MTIIVELTPETEARLQEHARSQGIAPPELVRKFIENALETEEDEDEKSWERFVAANLQTLEQMAEQARAERKAGLCVPLETVLIELSEQLGEPLTSEELAELKDADV